MNPFTKVASVIFGIIALLHLLRMAFFPIEIVVDGCSVPVWASIIGFIVTAILSIGLWKEAGRKL